MANDLTDNPLVVDTAHATTRVYNGPCSLAVVRWIGGTTAGHQAILKDGDGAATDATAKWEGIAAAANAVVETVFPTANRLHFKNGIVVPTLGSGRLYLYLARD